MASTYNSHRCIWLVIYLLEHCLHRVISTMDGALGLVQSFEVDGVRFVAGEASAQPYGYT